MAWIIKSKPLPRWVVGTRLVPDGQELHQRQLAYRFEDPNGRTPFRGSIFQQGLKVPLELFPKEAHILSSTKSPPDFINISGWGVSDKVRGLIDGIEPETHQFVEVETFLKNGDPAPEKYFMAVLGHCAVNQIDDELTTLRRKPDGEIELPSADGARGDVVVRRRATLGWHAWFSADIYFSFTISDELKALFDQEKIAGLDYVHLAEREHLNT